MDRHCGIITHQRVALLALVALMGFLSGAAQAQAAAPEPVPVLGLAGSGLALHAAARLPDGSVVIAGERAGRPLAARVRASGLLEERFGARGVWSPPWRGAVRELTMFRDQLSLAVQRDGSWDAVTLSARGKAGTRKRGVEAPSPVAATIAVAGSWAYSPDGACLGGISGGQVSVAATADAAPAVGGQLLTPQLTLTDPSRAFSAAARPLSAFSLKDGACGMLVADGKARFLVLGRGPGRPPKLRAVASGAASQVASRCLDHVLIFGVRGRQTVVQAAGFPAATKGSAARLSLTGCD